MINIKPISDLRNKFTEIEGSVQNGEEVILTKNGYGTMVVMSIERYSQLTDLTEMKLDEADRLADASYVRLSHDDVFGKVRALLNE
ncbi:MAG: type II toxin-antitoxin system prevent-host-death family antitoxin [Ruminococcus sp.]|nr:type II toxin-antitoxin system prevent-host-death family antitoxin [Ruminococcus sp.]